MLQWKFAKEEIRAKFFTPIFHGEFEIEEKKMFKEKTSLKRNKQAIAKTLLLLSSALADRRVRPQRPPAHMCPLESAHTKSARFFVRSALKKRALYNAVIFIHLFSSIVHRKNKQQKHNVKSKNPPSKH